MNQEMTSSTMLVRAMKQAGIDRVFSLSGNHIMPIYNAMREEGMKIVHTRHEAAAVHMADAWFRLTGKTGVALVAGGPGHANAVSALYTAQMNESAVVLLSGYAPLNKLGWGAFQEMDQVAMVKPVVKEAWAVQRADDMGMDFAKACSLAHAGRPGPVHLSLPINVIESTTSTQHLPSLAHYRSPAQTLSSDHAHTVLEALNQSKKPLILVGPQGVMEEAKMLAQTLETRTGVPVIISESPRGINDPSLGAYAEVLADSDAVLLLGKRLDFTLGFGAQPIFAASCRFMQIDPDDSELGRSSQALGPKLIWKEKADVAPALKSLVEAAENNNTSSERDDWRSSVHHKIHYRPANWSSATSTKGVHPVTLFSRLQKFIDKHPDTVLVIDGGEFGQWAQACLTASRRLTNGVAGAIGAGIPMAIAAKIANPNAPVVCIVGDGTFGFHCAEFDTAYRANSPIICLVGNDARWNAEYQIQVREYGADNVYGCDLVHSRYDQVAVGFGAQGFSIQSDNDIQEALGQAFAGSSSSCINVLISGVPAPIVRTK